MNRRLLLSAGIAAATTCTVGRVLDRAARTRPNYRGEPVTLSLGPAVAAGLLAGALETPALVAVGGAAAAGWWDDRASAREDERLVKGFGGHLGALAAGRASAGTVKLGVIGATSLAAAAIRRGVGLDALIDGCLVAGTANLVNLFDLRPGRALKVTALIAAGAPAAPVTGAVLGAVAAAGPADLAEHSMLGDTGANALGAAVGSALCRRTRTTRVLAVAVIAALTAVSERVSFSAVIAGNPVLRRLDELGRG